MQYVVNSLPEIGGGVAPLAGTPRVQQKAIMRTAATVRPIELLGASPSGLVEALLACTNYKCRIAIFDGTGPTAAAQRIYLSRESVKLRALAAVNANVRFVAKGIPLNTEPAPGFYFMRLLRSGSISNHWVVQHDTAGPTFMDPTTGSGRWNVNNMQDLGLTICVGEDWHPDASDDFKFSALKL